MCTLLQEDYPKSNKVLARRNWLEITPVQSAPDIPDRWRVEKGALVMTLRVEDPENQKATPAAYPTLVPAYFHDPKGQAHVPALHCLLRTVQSESGMHIEVQLARRPATAATSSC